MKSHNLSSGDDRGSTLVVAVLMLAVAGITVGSILTTQLSYSRNAEASNSREVAAFLADAGLQSAIVKLNEASDGNITYSESRSYFSRTNAFRASNWGFQTQYSSTGDRSWIISIGRYGSESVQVQTDVTLGAGNRSIHALYAHAIFAGNSANTNYTMSFGGTGVGADFVRGDVYSGKNITVEGNAYLRLPEILVDTNGNDVCEPGETWTNAYAVRIFTNPVSQAVFNAYTNSMRTNMAKVYSNGRYDYGEAYVDTIGNGRYDLGEPFTDLNSNGVREAGDSFIDRNGNGVYDAGIDTVKDYGNGRWDPGEEWWDDPNHSQRRPSTQNPRQYDPFGGFWKLVSGHWVWTLSYKSGGKTYWATNWPAENYTDDGDGQYTAAEPYIDQNGVYDPGEQYVDDRNAVYDYGTQARGTISGMPAPGPGQTTAPGGNDPIDPPDLAHMFYAVNKTNETPAGALTRWGNDVLVNSNAYGSAVAITSMSNPRHIFVRNPPKSGSVSSGGKTINGRSYTTLYSTNGVRIDDYFLEDPADSSYNSYDTGHEIDGTVYTAPMWINVTNSASEAVNGNGKLYYVDGNLYIHHPNVYSMRFKQPGTRITIVASGNITISDEVLYNADYDPNLERADMNSAVVKNPYDALCLIALKNPRCPTNSGNIYIGDAQYGTGGSIHAMLYAENDFVDNNINSVDQQYISVFGNMTAGNQVRLNRATGGGYYRTRLDVTLDDRFREGTIIVPGLPHPVGSQRSIIVDTAWHIVGGTWGSWTMLK